MAAENPLSEIEKPVEQKLKKGRYPVCPADPLPAVNRGGLSAGG